MEPQTEVLSSVVDMISNVGFPIFISLFLLHRMETKVDAVVKALNELTTVMSRSK